MVRHAVDMRYETHLALFGATVLFVAWLGHRWLQWREASALAQLKLRGAVCG